MEWIYLSPHFDDVAFSCGGLVWEQVESGDKVTVLTICAGEPPPGPLSQFAQSLHKRWATGQDAVAVRKSEDLLSSQRMGAASCSFPIPDAIYRRSPVDNSPLYISDPDLFSELRPEESHLVKALGNELLQALPSAVELVCPLALGGHVDHRLVRAAVESLGRELWYYADYPYSKKPDEDIHEEDREMLDNLFPISEMGLEIWQKAIAAHSSQISTFWSSTDQMRAAIHQYWEPIKGVRLWRYT